MANLSMWGTMNPRPRHHVSDAFTVIELLGVIPILICVLLPAWTKAREASRPVDCANLLKQPGLTLAVYTGENVDFFPPRNTSNGVLTTEVILPVPKACGQRSFGLIEPRTAGRIYQDAACV